MQLARDTARIPVLRAVDADRTLESGELQPSAAESESATYSASFVHAIEFAENLSSKPL
jgi:hypothetical protein